jgi:hypothetical protein
VNEVLAVRDYMRDSYKLLVGKPEGKIPRRRPRRRWEGNIKVDLKEIVCGGVMDSSGSG